LSPLAGLVLAKQGVTQAQSFERKDPNRFAPASVRGHEAIQLLEPVLDVADLRGFRLTYGFDHQETLTVEGNVVSRSADSR